MKIGVFAASHSFFEEPYQSGLAWIRSLGHEVREAPGIRSRHRYFAGDDDTRLAGFLHVAQDPDISVVWAIRGGSGALRIADRIPWDRLPPKVLLGFSDVTPLLHAAARAGWQAWHAPVVHSIPKTDAESLQLLGQILDGGNPAPMSGTPWVAGDASGPLTGGNLCLIAAGCGTRHQLDATDSVLVLEEIGETPYRIDRMLTQLRQAGVMDGLAGVALGAFTDCLPPAGSLWSLEDMLREHLEPLGVPVLAHLPVGHGPQNHPWQVGARAYIQGSTLSFRADRSAS